MLNRKLKEIQVTQEKTAELHRKQLEELERISGLSIEEAKQYLLRNVEDEVKHEMAVLVKELEAKAREEAETKARDVIATAIQKCAADHVSETTVSVVPLPNDEMKGRIIGREGRNIRTLETLTGIDLIIDDTPEAVILSGFDPIRREVARITLKSSFLMEGSIPPGSKKWLKRPEKKLTTRYARKATGPLFETGVHGLHPELVKLLGSSGSGQVTVRTYWIIRSRWRHWQVSWRRTGSRRDFAKRAGLLHDIGRLSTMN